MYYDQTQNNTTVENKFADITVRYSEEACALIANREEVDVRVNSAMVKGWIVSGLTFTKRKGGYGEEILETTPSEGRVLVYQSDRHNYLDDRNQADAEDALGFGLNLANEVLLPLKDGFAQECYIPIIEK